MWNISVEIHIISSRLICLFYYKHHTPVFQAGTQFKQSLAQLMDILMSKEPSYIRCIKPNDDKRPSK